MNANIVEYHAVQNKLYSKEDLFKPLRNFKVQSGTAYIPDDFIVSAFIDHTHATKHGLMQTASGYGNKLVTQYKVKCQNGKTYRVYCRCYSNSGTLYILINGMEKVFLYDSVILDKLENKE